MNFQSLEYFLVVYEERSVSKAARRLFVSQQSLSARLLRLEEQCGTPLFSRRPVFQPTYAGDRLAETAREILRLRRDVLSELREIGNGKRGRINLGFSGFLISDYLPAILCRFHERFPDIELTVSRGDSETLEKQTLDGRLDLYVGSTRSDAGEMNYVPLTSIYLVAAVRDEVLKNIGGYSDEQIEQFSRTGVLLEDLRNIPLIAPVRGWRVREAIDRYAQTHNLHLNIALECAHAEAVVLSKKGLGAGIVYSTSHVHDDDGGVRVLRLNNLGYQIDTGVCWRKDHFLTLSERELVEAIESVFSQDIAE